MRLILLMALSCIACIGVAQQNAGVVDPHSDFREWSDSSGKFRVEAKAVSYAKTHVTLQRKQDGYEIRVPVNSLSKTDRDFCASGLEKQKNKEAVAKLLDAISVFRIDMQALQDSNETTAKREHLSQQRWQKFIESVKGTELNVTMRVVDVEHFEQGQFVFVESGYRVSVEDIDFPAERKPSQIILAENDPFVGQMKKGSTIMITGKLYSKFSPHRGSIEFNWEAPSEKPDYLQSMKVILDIKELRIIE